MKTAVKKAKGGKRDKTFKEEKRDIPFRSSLSAKKSRASGRGNSAKSARDGAERPGAGGERHAV
jgi:hypothetical protein